MSDNISFDQHNRNLNIAINGMVKALIPLNEKLAPLDMMIYISGAEVWVSPFAANSRNGLSIYIDDNEIERMMSMTGDQLINKLRIE